MFHCLVAVQGLYAGAIAILYVPMDVTAMVTAAKAWNLGPAFWFPMKAAMAFPLNYHYLNGIRHLVRIVFIFGYCQIIEIMPHENIFLLILSNSILKLYL